MNIILVNEIKDIPAFHIISNHKRNCILKDYAVPQPLSPIKIYPIIIGLHFEMLYYCSICKRHQTFYYKVRNHYIIYNNKDCIKIGRLIGK